MQPTTAFIFDMDGTLVDNMPYHYQSWLDVFAQMGVPMTLERLHQNDRGTVDQILRALLSEEISDAQVVKIAERKEAIYREIYRPHMTPVDGLQRFLNQARRLGIPMALATNARSGNVDYILDGLDLRACFPVVVGDEDVHKGKPDPEGLLLAATRAWACHPGAASSSKICAQVSKPPSAPGCGRWWWLPRWNPKRSAHCLG